LSKQFLTQFPERTFLGPTLSYINPFHNPTSSFFRIHFPLPNHLRLRLPSGFVLSEFMNISHISMSPRILHIKPISRFLMFMTLTVLLLSVTGK